MIDFENSDTPEEAAAAKEQWERFGSNSARLQLHILEYSATNTVENIYASPGSNSLWAIQYRKQSRRQLPLTRKIADGSPGTFLRRE